MDWRRPVLLGGLYLTRKGIPENLNKIHEIEFNESKLRQLQEKKLCDIIKHAIKTVPYYQQNLSSRNVISNNGVNWEEFESIPLLTKNKLRLRKKDMKSQNPGRSPYWNTSGGTTGKPVEFWQDQDYWHWNVTNKIYYQSLAGKKIGEPETKLWGNERDILEGNESLKKRIRNFLYNRQTLNSFVMNEDNMQRYVNQINNFEPKTIWAYVESIHQLAKYIDNNERTIHSPKGIISTAGTLHEPVRDLVERVFDTTVYNQYGTREVEILPASALNRKVYTYFPTRITLK